MAIRIKQNGNEVEKMQGEINALLAEYAETKDPETELKLIRLYEKKTNFKPGCGICVAGRAHFVKSLGQLKSGDIDGAFKSFNASRASLKVKWDILRGKFKGK